MRIMLLVVFLAGCATPQDIDDRITNRELIRQIEALREENQKLGNAVLLYHKTLEDVIIAYKRVERRCPPEQKL